MQNKEVVRMCTVCRAHKQKNELIRIVKNKDGEIFVDKTGKKPGRGAYICDDIKCFEAAQKKKCLERAFSMQIPAEIYDLLKEAFCNE